MQVDIVSVDRNASNKNFSLEEFLIDREDFKILNIEKFLERYINLKYKNIVILSGHGGPFQSLLDLEYKRKFSVNTLELLKTISKFNIDTVFLDMCGMNYIEVIYELLQGGNIKKVITYRKFAPFEGIEYAKFLNCILSDNLEESFSKLNDDLIYVDYEMLSEFESFKERMNKFINRLLLGKESTFSSEIDKFRKEKIDIGVGSKRGKKGGLNYIRYYLENADEREIYGQYSFLKSNLWSIIITKKLYSDLSFEKEVIDIEKDGIENLIYLHNKDFSEKEVKKYLYLLCKIWSI